MGTGISGFFNIDNQRRLEYLENVGGRFDESGETLAVVLGYDGFLRVVLVVFGGFPFSFLISSRMPVMIIQGWSFEKERQGN